MKFKLIVVSALALGLSGVTHAADYYAPERLSCKMAETGKLNCAQFNRAYLAEHTHTANFPDNKTLSFTFESGAAYHTSQDQWVVIYSYKNVAGKNVTLKTVNTSIQPDMTMGAWEATKDFYTCKAGYMSCPITNLPDRNSVKNSF